MKAVAYGRQSSGDDDFSESVELQIEKCKALAEREGIELIGVYSDNNSSGKLFPEGSESLAEIDLAFQAWFKGQTTKKKSRKGLGDALQRLDEIDYIVVYDITRLYRPVTGSFLEAYINQLLVAHDVKVWTVTNGLMDFSSFNDNLIIALQSRINDEQLKTQTEKSKAALKKLKDSGEYMAGLSLKHGYRATGRKREVEVDSREAEMVKEVFKLYASPMSTYKMMQKLNSDFPDIFKDALCTRKTIRTIVNDPCYCGYMRDSSGELIKSKQLAGKEIVSVDAWMNACKKLELHKKTAFRPKKRFLPLSPFIYCGHCGHKMQAHGGWKEQPHSYKCLKYMQVGGMPCKNSIPSSRDEKEGLGLMEAVKPLLLAEAMKQMKRGNDDSEAKKRLAEIEIGTAELKRKMQKLTSMWMDGTMAEDVYESAMKELKSKMKSSEAEKTKIEMELSRDTAAFDWAKLMMKFREDALADGEYEQLANAMIKKIMAYSDKIEIKTSYGNVAIPRQRIWVHNLCFNYVLQMKAGKAVVYYYKGKADIKPASSRAYFCAAVFGDLTVYIEK